MNTALIVEPRCLERLHLVIKNFQKHLPTWKFVFYCGKGLTKHWEEKVDNVELRELDVNNLEFYEYNDLFRTKELWESLTGEYVLVFQADTWLLSIPPYDIHFYLSRGYSYIGGTLGYEYKECIREGYRIHNGAFNGGLSLRKRLDMIKIIDTFPPISNKYQYRQTIYTDAEDVYFVLGCLKLGLPLGMDPHFAVHSIFEEKCFGVHKPHMTGSLILQCYPEILQAHIPIQ